MVGVLAAVEVSTTEETALAPVGIMVDSSIVGKANRFTLVRPLMDRIVHMAATGGVAAVEIRIRGRRRTNSNNTVVAMVALGLLQRKIMAVMGQVGAPLLGAVPRVITRIIHHILNKKDAVGRTVATVATNEVAAVVREAVAAMEVMGVGRHILQEGMHMEAREADMGGMEVVDTVDMETEVDMEAQSPTMDPDTTMVDLTTVCHEGGEEAGSILSTRL